MTRWLIAPLLGLMAALGTARWAARRWVLVTVSGDSMEPALSDGDRVLIRRSRRLAVGDVVVAHLPGVPRGRAGPRDRLWLIKRVAALPGDPVPDSVSAAVGGDRAVPPERLVLLSDNADGSVDSRSLGYVNVELVLGVVVKRLGESSATRLPAGGRRPGRGYGSTTGSGRR